MKISARIAPAIALALLIGCHAHGMIRTGAVYPPRPEDAPVAVFLGEKRPDYEELGIIMTNGRGMGGLDADKIETAVERAKEVARENGGDCIILLEMHRNDDIVSSPTGSTTIQQNAYRFAIGRIRQPGIMANATTSTAAPQ